MAISDDSKYIAAAVLTSAALNRLRKESGNDEAEIKKSLEEVRHIFHIALDLMQVDLQ